MLRFQRFRGGACQDISADIRRMRNMISDKFIDCFYKIKRAVRLFEQRAGQFYDCLIAVINHAVELQIFVNTNPADRPDFITEFDGIQYAL